jgi:threonine dehydratase
LAGSVKAPVLVGEVRDVDGVAVDHVEPAHPPLQQRLDVGWRDILKEVRLVPVEAGATPMQGANPTKIGSIRALEPTSSCTGATSTRPESTAHNSQPNAATATYTQADEPHLIAGVATITLEILEQQPEIDVVIVPVGGGSGAAPLAAALKLRDRLAGKRVALICSGGNINLPQLKDLIANVTTLRTNDRRRSGRIFRRGCRRPL